MSGQTPQGPQYNTSSNQGIITSVTPTGQSMPTIPFKPGVQDVPGIERTTQTYSGLAQDYGRLTDKARLNLAQNLKRAGYNVPVTGRYNLKVREAFLAASTDFDKEVRFLSQNDPQMLANRKYDLTAYLEDLAKEGGAGAQGPSIVRRKTEYRPETIDLLITTAFQDLTGRGPSKEELAKYRSIAGKELAKPSSMGQTTYTNVSGQVQEQVTKEAFDPKEFLYSQIAGTDEAKANKVFGFYNAFKRVLGV